MQLKSPEFTYYIIYNILYRNNIVIYKIELINQGTFTSSDGGKYVGEVREGKPWNTTRYDKEELIIGKWVNGVEQKGTP